MTADATVVALAPAAPVTAMPANRRVEVEFRATQRCSGCQGACLWRRLSAAERLTLETPLPLAVGDPVVVALPDRYLLLGSTLVHGLPLAALLLGAVAGSVVGGSDAAAAIGAVAGVGAALLAAPRLRSRLERDTLSRVELRPGTSAHAQTHSL